MLIVIVVLFPGCSQEKPKEFILFDFESDSDLDKFGWNCHTLYSLSEKHATHGFRSLKMDLFPSEYPGLVFSPALKDWREYKEFCFDVFNPSQKPIEISVRIDDKKDNPDYKNRYNRRHTISPGHNRVIIPLNTLMTSSANRRMDLSNISQILVYLVNPRQKTTLYLDAFTLR